MKTPQQDDGARGERLAADYLRRQGFHILERNYRRRAGEIDLVAREGETLCFVEVRTRRDLRFGRPEETVTPVKRAHLTRTATAYLQQHGLRPSIRAYRFDLVAIVWGATPAIQLIRNILPMSGGPAAGLA